MSSRMKVSLAALCAAGLLAGIAAGARDGQSASPKAVGGFETECAAFARTALIRGATLQIGFSPAAADAPGSCVVHGTMVSSPTSTIHFRLDLPDPTLWNRRLVSVGGGGFDGVVETDRPGFRAGLTRMSWPHDFTRYAIFATDSGHQGLGGMPFVDFSWAEHNPTALINHGYRANHVVLWASVGLVQAFYGRPPAWRYRIGYSNGGRQGLAAAEHYPKDYNGIVAMAPAISQEAFTANITPTLQHVFSSPDNWLSPAQIQLLQNAEVAACDALDGVKDGIVGNVAACHYDVAALKCNTGESPPACLTAGQVKTVKMILADKDMPVAMADGLVGYPGWGRGAEASDWPRFLFGTSFAARDSFDYLAADNIVKYGITGDPNASVMTHRPEQWAKQYLALSRIIDATDPNLAPFHAAGGKLIIWHGVGDACLPARRTAEYVDMVERRLGMSTTGQFLRFYTSPGEGHMDAGPGAGAFDLLGAVEAWVEQGRAPDGIIATKLDRHGKALLTRPLCEYPGFPRFKGGAPDAASSFFCSKE